MEVSQLLAEVWRLAIRELVQDVLHDSGVTPPEKVTNQTPLVSRRLATTRPG
jgi:hypothetical protein